MFSAELSRLAWRFGEYLATELRLGSSGNTRLIKKDPGAVETELEGCGEKPQIPKSFLHCNQGVCQ